MRFSLGWFVVVSGETGIVGSIDVPYPYVRYSFRSPITNLLEVLCCMLLSSIDKI